MFALRIKTQSGWSKAEAFESYDAARAAIPPLKDIRGFMIGANVVRGPFVPGEVPRLETRVIHSLMTDFTKAPTEFFGEPVERAGEIAA